MVCLPGQDSFAIDTVAAFGTGSTPGVYGNLEDGAVDIMRHAGLGPIEKWADDHVFFWILREHLPAYNHLRSLWHSEISKFQRPQHVGGRIWYNGPLLPDGSCAKFNDDMSSPVRDLSGQSPHSVDNA